MEPYLENTIIADVISEDEVIWVIQSSETGVFIKWGSLNADTQGKCHVKIKTDEGDTSTSQGIPRSPGNH